MVVAVIICMIIRMAILAAMAIRRASMLATARSTTAPPATRGMIAFGVIGVLRQHGAGGDRGQKPTDHKPPVDQIAIHDIILSRVCGGLKTATHHVLTQVSPAQRIHG
jgi:hypothetical protein